VGARRNCTPPGLAAPVAEIAAGDPHFCARTLQGDVSCWGHDGVGQLGDGTFVSSETPVLVAGLPPIRSISLGLEHSCAGLRGACVLLGPKRGRAARATDPSLVQHGPASGAASDGRGGGQRGLHMRSERGRQRVVLGLARGVSAMRLKLALDTSPNLPSRDGVGRAGIASMPSVPTNSARRPGAGEKQNAVGGHGRVVSGYAFYR